MEDIDPITIPIIEVILPVFALLIPSYISGLLKCSEMAFLELFNPIIPKIKPINPPQQQEVKIEIIPKIKAL